MVKEVDDFAPRNTPTCDHFAQNLPVEKTILVPRNERCLNRIGRAIIRIVAAHGWTASAIARIFSVSVSPVKDAMANKAYNTPDDVSKDYELAPDEYMQRFPPKGRAHAVPESRGSDGNGVPSAYLPAGSPESDHDIAFYSANDPVQSKPIAVAPSLVTPQAVSSSFHHPRSGSSSSPSHSRRPSLSDTEARPSFTSLKDYRRRENELPPMSNTVTALEGDGMHLYRSPYTGVPTALPSSIIDAYNRDLAKVANDPSRGLDQLQFVYQQAMLPALDQHPASRSREISPAHALAPLAAARPPQRARTMDDDEIKPKRKRKPKQDGENDAALAEVPAKRLKTAKTYTGPAPHDNNTLPLPSIPQLFPSIVAAGGPGHSHGHPGYTQAPVEWQFQAIQTPSHYQQQAMAHRPAPAYDYSQYYPPLPPGHVLPPPRPLAQPMHMPRVYHAQHPPTNYYQPPPQPAFNIPVANVAITPFAQVLVEQGITTERIKALARWPQHARESAMKKVQLERVDWVALEQLIRQFASVAGPDAPPLRTLDEYLASTPTPMLPLFLTNAVGFDLSAHTDVLEQQGLGLAALTRLARSYNSLNDNQNYVSEMLARSLSRGSKLLAGLPQGAGVGMSPIEVVALEFAVCGFGAPEREPEGVPAPAPALVEPDAADDS
ncbi:hypothetical protein HMN09_01105000 [Mycena chlorophos]|uniref:Uncharacterized protein n=1 Tax=Mycena chlorophos TaxID=658473 RepID=A0A8H6W1Y3_MYCCL|nr:hypothetical protein HMN09_01105000 [Mycena chlorophos]